MRLIHYLSGLTKEEPEGRLEKTRLAKVGMIDAHRKAEGCLRFAVRGLDAEEGLKIDTIRQVWMPAITMDCNSFVSVLSGMKSIHGPMLTGNQKPPELKRLDEPYIVTFTIRLHDTGPL